MFTRRTLVQGTAFGAASTILPQWLDISSLAADRPKRSDYASPVGQKMLELFKKAIDVMRNDGRKLPRYHPHNWYFQANMHAHPSSDTSVFNARGQGSEEKKKIASYKKIALGANGKKGVWSTCSHFDYPSHFLTWHRLYLYFFERIVEKYAGEPFALPYWPYRPENRDSWKLPSTFFAKTVGGKPNPLYYSGRNATFVKGGIRTAGEVDASDAMRSSQLLPNTRDDGFSFLLESTPHGNVHVAVGTVEGMAVFEYAGRDPIFWLHHANIDRLWESWRRAGVDGASAFDDISGAETEAKNNWNQYDKFNFVDANGMLVAATVSDAIKSASVLGTLYDKLDPVQGPPGAPSVLGFAQAGTPTTLSKKKDTPQTIRITKEDAPVGISVAPAVAPPVALGFAGRSSTRYDLLIDVEASGPPGAAYQVFIKTAKSAGSLEKVDRPIKTFNLFTHAGHGSHIKASWKADITMFVKEKLIDPTAPVELTIRARYADPAVPVEIKNVQIRAR